MHYLQKSSTFIYSVIEHDIEMLFNITIQFNTTFTN